MIQIYFLRFYLFIYRERGRKGEREGEKHQCVVASHALPLETPPATLACALTGNRTGDPLVLRPALNPVSHTSRGGFCFCFKSSLEDTFIDFRERKRERKGRIKRGRKTSMCGCLLHTPT